MSSSHPFALSRTIGGPLGSSSSNGLQSRQMQAVTKPAPVLDLPALQSASRVLQDQFIKDAQVIPDLVDTLNTREHIVAHETVLWKLNVSQRLDSHRPHTASLQKTIWFHSQRGGMLTFLKVYGNTIIVSTLDTCRQHL